MAVRNTIGLDIGSTAIRAVETSRGKQGLSLTAFAMEPLPAGAVSGGAIQDSAAVVDAIKRLWSSTKFRGRQVVLGVTHRQVVVREMTVSNLPDRELHASLPFQVRQVLPLPVEHSLLDFHRLGEHASGSTVRGLLIAAPKEAVLAMVTTTEQAGLRVAGVDLASFALLRATSRLDATIEALADIGSHATTVVVHSDGVPLIVRTIPRGGQEITDLLAKRLDITTGEAEAAKCRVGVIAPPDDQTADLVREAVRPLLNEIRSSFAYLTSSGDQPTRVSRLVLSGGGALLPGLADLLVEHLGVEIRMADPVARIRGHGVPDALARIESAQAVAAVSIGLALGGMR